MTARPPEDPVSGVHLAVVGVPDTVQMSSDDVVRFGRDFQLGGDSTYTALVWDALVPQLAAELDFQTVTRGALPAGVVVTPVRAHYPLNDGRSHPPGTVTTALPAAGTTLTIDGVTPDYVLFLNEVTAIRARAGMQRGVGFMVGAGGGLVGTRGGEDGVALQARVTLWDNRTGQALGVRTVQGAANGEAQGPLGLGGRSVGRDAWRGAAAALAHNVLRELPLAERRAD